jgi:hypothetical protein
MRACWTVRPLQNREQLSQGHSVVSQKKRRCVYLKSHKKSCFVFTSTELELLAQYSDEVARSQFPGETKFDFFTTLFISVLPMKWIPVALSQWIKR